MKANPIVIDFGSMAIGIWAVILTLTFGGVPAQAQDKCAPLASEIAIAKLLDILETGKKPDRTAAAKAFAGATYDSLPKDTASQKRLIQVYAKSKGAVREALDSTLKRIEVTGILTPEATDDFIANVKNGKPGALQKFMPPNR